MADKKTTTTKAESKTDDKSETVKVMFRQSYEVKAVNGETYEKGKTYDLTPDSAEHFIRRGVAGDPKEVAKELKAADAEE